MNRIANIALEREAKVSSWNFILENYQKLARFYAWRYACVLKDIESVGDHTHNILMEMVKAFDKYYFEEKVGLKQAVKIIKTVPVYYYQNVIKRKHNQVIKVSWDDNVSTEDVGIVTIFIKDMDRFTTLYDKYYEMFLSRQYKMDGTDEVKVLMEILSPSLEYQKFMAERKAQYISQANLRAFFKYKKKWHMDRFEEALCQMQRLRVA